MSKDWVPKSSRDGKIYIPHQGLGIVRGRDLWPLYFDADPRLDHEPGPADVMHARGVPDTVEVSVSA
jgi:hypothetical protein